jgi:hypothetical protein
MALNWMYLLCYQVIARKWDPREERLIRLPEEEVIS